MDQMMAATQTKPVTSEQARPFIFSLRWACAWPAQRSSFREAGTAEQSTRSIPACQMKVVSWRQPLHEPGNRRLCASKQPRDGNSRRRGCAAAGKRASRLVGRGRQRRRRAGRALQRRLSASHDGSCRRMDCAAAADRSLTHRGAHCCSVQGTFRGRAGRWRRR